MANWPGKSKTCITSASSSINTGPALIPGMKERSMEGPRPWRRTRTNVYGSCSRPQKEQDMPRGKNRVWLKMDKISKVKVRIGSANVEIRLIVPADRIRKQLDRLKAS